MEIYPGQYYRGNVRKFIGPKSRFLAQNIVFYSAWQDTWAIYNLIRGMVKKKLSSSLSERVRKFIELTRGV